MVSQVERLSRELEALRLRVEALERRLATEAELPEEEVRELERMRDEAEDGDHLPLDEILARYGKRRV